MEIAHLGVFLDVEGVIHIPADAEAHCINRDHSISLWSLEHMELNDVLLGSRHDSEFTQTHLKHHILSEEDFLSHHYESSCR